MIDAMWNLFVDRKEFFFQLTIEHLKIAFIAIIIATLIGGLVGIMISEYKKSANLSLGVINFLYTIPSISMLGFLIPFFGVGNTTAIIALTVYALLPMVRNTHTGMLNIDSGILEAAKGMGSTRFQILWKIKLPLALPIILSGIRNMVTMTIALAGIASFIGAGGLGVAIYRGITTNNAAMTMLGSLLIALLALVIDMILGWIEKRIYLRNATAKKTNRKLVVGAALLATLLLFVTIFQGNKKETLHIATKPMSEQYILGEMLKLVIEQDTDLEVELTQGVGGGTANIMPAMKSGEFDIYPEYTGTGWNMVLKKEGLYNEEMFSALQKEYQETLGMQWTNMYGFNNTYGLAVRSEIAQKYNITTYSDLQTVAGMLTFGAEYDFFEREDGYDALCQTYGLSFGKTMDLDIGLKYQAIAQEKIDVMNIFTTDGQLSSSDVVVLKDDKNFYPSYLCGNVIRQDVLLKHPELQEVFDKMTNILTDTSMAKLNFEVETNGKEPKTVAKSFLLDAGILKEK